MLIIYETRLDIFRGNSSNKSRNQDRREIVRDSNSALFKLYACTNVLFTPLFKKLL